MEHSAFLTSPVFDVDGLVHELRASHLVQQHYESHFHLNQDSLQREFSSLHLEPLMVGKRYLVYNVDETGVVRSRMLLLPFGTQVFADQKHKPILKRSCGNPMIAVVPVSGEPGQDVHSESSQKPVDELKQDGLPIAEAETATDEILASTASSFPLAEEPLVADVVSPVATTDVMDQGLSEVAPLVFDGTYESPPSLFSAGPTGVGGSIGSITGGLGFLGTLFGTGHLFTSGGSSHSPVPPRGSSPVPEPTMLVGFAIGLWALRIRRRS